MEKDPDEAGVSKRARNRARNLGALLEAAEVEFSRKGFQGASVSEIADAAGLAVGTVYRFFPGKRELGSAVMERIAESRVENLRAVALPAASDRDAALRTLVSLRVSHHVRHGAFLRMGFELQRSLGRRDPPERIRALFDETRDLTRRFFEIGLGLGFWRDLPPVSLARAFDGICNEEIFTWERLGRPGGEEKLFDTIYATVSTLFAASAPASGGRPRAPGAPSGGASALAVLSALALLPCVASASPAAPLSRTFEKDGAKAVVRFEPGEARPGETVEAVLSVSAPPGVEAKLPPASAFDDRFEGFSVLGSYEDPDGSLHFSLSPVPGAEKRRLRPFPVEVADSSTAPPARTWFAAGPLSVPEAPPVAAAGEVVPPLKPVSIAPSPKRLLEGLGAAAGAVALAFGAVALARRLRRAAAVRRLPPKRRAFLELDALLRRGLPEKGRFKDFYFELALVVRRYIERRHGIRAPRQTTEEFLASVSGRPDFPPRTVARLSEFLSAADLVKFAGKSSTPALAAAAADSARAYLSAEPD